jgi:hypothetical protein
MTLQLKITARIAEANAIAPPTIETIAMQVRTGVSVPFAPHMLRDSAAAPSIQPVAMQVRTGVSVPFATYMLGDAAAPSVDSVNMQVRTGVSVPFADYMAKSGRSEKTSAASADLQVRTGVSVQFNPYMLGANAEELLKKRIMISPVVVVWQYRVADEEEFKAWLATREILLSESRISGDAELKGVRYGGTYRVASDKAGTATYTTVWGYASEAAMDTMHRLCSDGSVSATLVQLELIEFVKGLKKLIAQAGEKHFTQEVLISAAAGRAA